MSADNASCPPATAAMPTARDKIVTLEAMGELVRLAREDGEQVVLCHGVFDLLHMGHVRHLEAARREGTRLCVTLTGDRFVNKGPGRPIFPEGLRAEMLAACQYVDWVAVNHAPTAENVLDVVRPSVYVKGSDYENPDDDVTGKIRAEKDAVEQHGGRLVFTRDVTFSSSTLINRYLDVYDPPLRDFLEELRQEDATASIAAYMDKIKAYKVVMVGDTIIDEYNYVDTLERSSKEQLIATLFKSREVFAGGVVAAANHVADLVGEVEIVTVLGEDDSYEDLVRASLKPNVRLTVIRRPGAPTTRKTRFIEPNYVRKLFEVYHMDDSPYAAEVVDQVNVVLADRCPTADVVVVTDFGHGMLTPGTIGLLRQRSRFLTVNTQTNAGNLGFNFITKYASADYVCIDHREARFAAADKYCDVAELVGQRLPALVDCDRIIVTAGLHGSVSYERDKVVQRVPAFTKQVVDTVGAGDAFLAVTAPLVAAGCPMHQVAFVGNAAGAIKVGIVGHRSSVDKVALLKFVNTLLK